MYIYICIEVHCFITELIMELHVDMTWNDELNDKNSVAFKDLSQVFVKEVSVISNNYEGFKRL